MTACPPALLCFCVPNLLTVCMAYRTCSLLLLVRGFLVWRGACSTAVMQQAPPATSLNFTHSTKRNTRARRGTPEDSSVMSSAGGTSQLSELNCSPDPTQAMSSCKWAAWVCTWHWDASFWVRVQLIGFWWRLSDFAYDLLGDWAARGSMWQPGQPRQPARFRMVSCLVQTLC